MTTYQEQQARLQSEPKTWLVTGAAGFIGSNIVEVLLRLGQRVSGLDNFSTGHSRNLGDVQRSSTPEQWSRFTFIEGDIREPKSCQQACRGVDYVLHQAALGSVPGSLADPIGAHESNVSGFLNMLVAARDAGVKRFVYASSCALYGDRPELPKREGMPADCLSPYATTKLFNEEYAAVFARCYGMTCAGLRYFNVFGPRQDPNGPYAAVIPRWIASMIGNDPVTINGDGENSRDFCYVANVVQANLLGALAESSRQGWAEVYNVAVGERTSLSELFEMLRSRLQPKFPHLEQFRPVYGPFRESDVRHSEADISKARTHLAYEPTHRTADGLDEALNWYVAEAGGLTSEVGDKGLA